MNNNKEASLTIQKAFVNNSKEVLNRDNLFDEFNKNLAEFYENPEYGTFKKLQDAIKEIDTQVKEAVKNLLIENDLKSSSGPAGRFTLVETKKVNYNIEEGAVLSPKVKRILKLKDQLKKLEDDVKDDVLLFGKNVEGTFVTTTPSVRFYAAKKENKGKEIVADYVSFEKGVESN